MEEKSIKNLTFNSKTYAYNQHLGAQIKKKLDEIFLPKILEFKNTNLTVPVRLGLSFTLRWWWYLERFTWLLNHGEIAKTYKPAIMNTKDVKEPEFHQEPVFDVEKKTIYGNLPRVGCYWQHEML